MGTTKTEIASWFENGVRGGSTHMVVVCDDYDHEDYPIFLNGTESEAREKVAEYGAGEHSMQRVMEVYSLSMDMERQLSEPSSFNYAVIPKPESARRSARPANTGARRNRTMASRIWTVMDPAGMAPELGECVFEQTVMEQARHVVGMGLAEYERRNPALHSSEEDAMQDLARRLVIAVDNLTSLRGQIHERLSSL